MSNDYKSMLGLWNKLTAFEKKKFIKENIDSDYISNELIYYDYMKKQNRNEDMVNELKKEIENALNQKELPSIDFSK